MWHKFTTVLAIAILMAMVIVGIIDSLPVPMVVEKTVIQKDKTMMRVALVGDFNTTVHDDGSTTTERPVFVGDVEGTMHRVFDYGPDFEGILKEGDRVYVTITYALNHGGYRRIEYVTIDYLITKEDYRNAE